MGNKSAEKVVIYTDGSCLGNPGPGGWGVIIQTDEGEEVLRGGDHETTNNRMEMTAVLEALKWLNKSCEGRVVEIYSDSNLVVQSIKEGWKRKANIDLWQEIDKTHDSVIGNGCKIEWHWVKGHADDQFNERVDKIAVEESKKQPRGRAEKRHTKSNKYFCENCKKETEGVLSLLPDSKMIRVDCTNCGGYIMFAEQTEKNLRRAKKRVLISKKQLEKVLDIMKKKGEEVGEGTIKKIKTWTKDKADRFIEEDQTLF